MISYNLDKILFLDIETVPQTDDYASLPEDFRELWAAKFEQLRMRFPDDATPEYGFLNSAGIFAEFGKVVCISVGFLHAKDGARTFRLRSFAGDDERQLLADFAMLLNRHYAGVDSNLCGHNIKEFDAPFIARRMLLNGIPLPDILDVAGEKPWNVHFLDTMEMWKFGDYKHFTSLRLMTHIFGIPTPKDDIDGSMVADVYYKEHDVERIVTYCEKDVLATARLFLKMRNLQTIEDDEVEHVRK